MFAGAKLRPNPHRGSNTRSSTRLPNKKLAFQPALYLVPREGFEPPTCGIEAHCSNPLSYRGVPSLCVQTLKTIGAGGENRTLVSSLEGWHNSHYTTPADSKYYTQFIKNSQSPNSSVHS